MAKLKCKHCRSESLSRRPKTNRQRFVSYFFTVKNYGCENCGRSRTKIVSPVPRPAAVALILLLVALIVPAVISLSSNDFDVPTERKMASVLNESANAPAYAATAEEGASEKSPVDELVNGTNDEVSVLKESEPSQIRFDEIKLDEIKPEPVDSFKIDNEVSTSPAVGLAQTSSVPKISQPKLTATKVVNRTLDKAKKQKQSARATPREGEINDKAALLEANPRYYTIQIASSSQRKNAEKFVEYITSELRLTDPVFVYLSPTQGAVWHPVLYGYYASREEAEKSKYALPDEIKQGQPFVRQMAAIQKVIR